MQAHGDCPACGQDRGQQRLCGSYKAQGGAGTADWKDSVTKKSLSPQGNLRFFSTFFQAEMVYFWGAQTDWACKNIFLQNKLWG